MKKCIFAVVLLMAGLGTAAAQNGNRKLFPTASFKLENKGTSSMANTPDYSGMGYGAIFSGSADEQGAAFTVLGPNLGINGQQRFIITVSGLNNGCKFDVGKLLKLEINKMPVLAESPLDRCPSDPEFIIARNGDFMFDISKLGNTTQITLVFYKCTLADVKIELSTE